MSDSDAKRARTELARRIRERDLPVDAAAAEEAKRRACDPTADVVDVEAMFWDESWHGPLGRAVREGLEQARRGEGIDLDELV